MKTHDVTKQAVSTANFLKVGPHEDLVEACIDEDLDDDSLDLDDDAESDSFTLDDFVQIAILSEDHEQRVAAARDALEHFEQKCGVAWLVLAREGSEDVNEAIGFANKAVEQLKLECDDENAAYKVDDEAYTLAIADLAQLTWQSGKHDEAIAILQKAVSETRTYLVTLLLSPLVEMTAAYLLLQGKAKEALETLQSTTRDEPQWHYLNALILFALEGDSLTSRSALARAFMKGTLTASAILKNDPNFDHEVVVAFGLDEFFKLIEPAWLSIAGAKEWLEAADKEPHFKTNRQLGGAAAVANDSPRWKRWQDLYESALHYVAKENDKEAKTAFKSALREAERIDYSYVPFLDTMASLMESVEHTKKSLADLHTQIKTRAKRFDASEALGEPLHAMHLQSFGALFTFLDDYEIGCAYQEQALKGIEKEIAAGSKVITLVDETEARNDVALSYQETKRYAEALALFSQNAEVIARYLGPQHVELLETLEPALRCLEELGESDKAAELTARIDGIDPAYLEDLKGAEDCDGCGHDHGHGHKH
jgi:tetratricopeptide (TPR) repeat protein